MNSVENRNIDTCRLYIVYIMCAYNVIDIKSDRVFLTGERTNHRESCMKS